MKKKTLRLTETELVDLIETTVKENINSAPKLPQNKVRLVKNRFTKWAKLNEGKKPNQAFASFSKECYKLRKHGYSDEVINEGLKQTTLLNEAPVVASDGAMGSIWNTVREGFYGWILGKFGVSGETKVLLRTVLGNVPVWDLPQLLMNCNLLVSAIVKGLPEYVAGWIGRSTLFGGKDTNFGMLMQNAIADYMDDTAIYVNMEKKIRSMICSGHEVKTDQLKDMFNKKASETSSAADVEPETTTTGGGSNMIKDLLSKIMSGGGATT